MIQQIHHLKLNQKNELNLFQLVDVRGTYSTNIQINFKTIILKSSLCDYSDAIADADGNSTNKKVIFEICTLFPRAK